jgi:hypothetical protein
VYPGSRCTATYQITAYKTGIKLLPVLRVAIVFPVSPEVIAGLKSVAVSDTENLQLTFEITFLSVLQPELEL